MSIKIGILGTAEIAPRSIIEPAKKIKGIDIFGVASREKTKAISYAQKHNIPNAYSSYESLLKNEEIDAVYIPLINSLHAEWTIKAIEAGKHVLVEKPICMNSKEIEQIKGAIKKNPQIIVVEGLMSQHHPWNLELLRIIKSKKFGSLINIKTQACYNIDEPGDFRLFPEKGGSVLFEEGLLWSHLTQYSIGLNPSKIESKCSFNGPNGGDHIFEVKTNYPEGVSSELFCSYNHPYQADHFIEFEKAIIKIRNFWRPTFGFVRLKFQVTNKLTNETSNISFEPENYFFNQLKHFIESIGNTQNKQVLDDVFERILFIEKIYNQASSKLQKESCILENSK